MLTLGAVGMSFHGFMGHIDYTCVSSRTCADPQLCLPFNSACALFSAHKMADLSKSYTEAVDADLRSGVFSENYNDSRYPLSR